VVERGSLARDMHAAKVYCMSVDADGPGESAVKEVALMHGKPFRCSGWKRCERLGGKGPKQV
jgi:hypothetical protein